MTSRPFSIDALEAIPSDSFSRKLAESLRHSCKQSEDSRVDLRTICSLLRAKVRVAELGGATGGQEALLVPLPGNRFGISVDPTPFRGWNGVPQALRSSLRRHRLRFRVAHELAHTFFYARTRNDTPQRRLLDSREQEDFCDLFSRSLLVPHRLAASMVPTPEALAQLQQRSDVSLEVAARAVAAAQPDLRVSIWFQETQGTLRLQWASTEATQMYTAASLSELKSREPAAMWMPHRRQLIAVARN